MCMYVSCKMSLLMKKKISMSQEKDIRIVSKKHSKFFKKWEGKTLDKNGKSLLELLSLVDMSQHSIM